MGAEYMGTHPIFESDFDCLTEKWRLTKNSVRSSFWLRNKNRIDQLQTGSDTVLVTPSSTTPRDDTGEEPRSVCKSLRSKCASSLFSELLDTSSCFGFMPSQKH